MVSPMGCGYLSHFCEGWKLRRFQYQHEVVEIAFFINREVQFNLASFLSVLVVRCDASSVPLGISAVRLAGRWGDRPDLCLVPAGLVR